MKQSALMTIMLLLSLHLTWAQDILPADSGNKVGEDTAAADPAPSPAPQLSQDAPTGKALLQEYFKANGLGQWQHDFDISGLEKGTYNLVVRGIDSAGNEIEGNAIDISIDPRSDLPTTSISFPTRGSVVTGNVTILGSAIDDDSIDYVEVKLGDGAYTRAEGREYWTTELETANLEDGEYTITARSTDIYGTVGEERSLSFHYNRKAPVISVDSIKNGDLVSRKVDVRGTIEDPNGISQMFVSLDEGETFEPVDLKGKLKDGNGEFNFTIDTVKLELPDGPQIIVLKGKDMRGGEGSAAFLVYIDNSDPVLDFIYPAEDIMPNGTFTIIGRAFDGVGVESLGYSYKGGETVPIPLQPGNPFWAINADFRNEKAAVLEFVITDIAGNVKRVTYKRDLDMAADLPTVQLLSPDAEVPLSHKRLQGWVLDDDAPKGIVYSFDKGEEQRIESGRSFDVDISSLSPGPHTLSIRGIDVFDVEGEPVVMKFNVVPEEPQVTGLAFVKPDGSAIQYVPGIRTDEEAVNAITGTIRFAGGGGTAACSLPGIDSVELDLKKGENDGEFVFTYKLPANMPFGYVPFSIHSVDELGSDNDYKAWFWMTNLSVNQLAHGFYLPSGTALLSRGRDFTLRYAGYPLESVELDPPLDFASVSFRGQTVSLTGISAGKAEGVRIKGKSDRGTEFESDPFTVLCDLEIPALSYSSDPSDMISSRTVISGTATDDAGSVSLSYVISGAEGAGSEQTVRVSDDGSFSFSINPSDISPAGSTLVLTARDGADNATSVYAAFLPDLGAEAPVKLYPAAPAKDQVVFAQEASGGRMLIAAGFSGIDTAQNVVAVIDDGEPLSLNGFPIASAAVDVPSPGVHTIKYSAETAEGKKLSGTQKFTVAGPKGSLKGLGIGGSFVQGGDYVRTEDAAFSGELNGSGVYRKSEFRFDGGDPQALKLTKSEGSSGFAIPLGKLKYGRHQLNLDFTDEFGRAVSGTYLFYLTAVKDGKSVEDNEGVYPLQEMKDINIVDDRLQFYFLGRDIQSIAYVSPEGTGQSAAEDILDISHNGSVITLDRAGSGRAEGVSFEVVTVDNDTFTYGPFNVSTDASAPVLTTSAFDSNIYFAESIPFTGMLEDDLSLAGLEYSIQGGPYNALDLVPASSITEASADAAPAAAQSFDDPAEWDFATDIPLSGSSDGPLALRLKAKDISGNERVYEYFLIKDTVAPVISQILPEAAEPVNGAVSLFVSMADQWAERYSGTFVLGETEAPLSTDIPTLEIPSDLSVFTELPEGITVSLSDNAGNTGVLQPVFSFDAAADLPRVQIQIPAENAVIQETTKVSGTTSDDDGIARIEYSIDDGEFIELPAGSSFEYDLVLENLTDNEHFTTVRAFDINGVESEHVVLNFRVSKELPVADMTSPELGTTNKGIVKLEGTAFDENGIDAVYLSVDNGNSFQKVSGTTEWYYDLDSQVLVDGNYMVLIRAVDGYGISALYSSLLTLDNTAPKVELALPMDGGSFTEDMPVQLRVTDELVVRRVEYSIEALDVVAPEGETVVPMTGGFETGNEVLLESLNLNELFPGRYSFSLYAYDDADNEVVVTRNIVKKIPNLRSVPKILFPLSGSSVSGSFYVEGRVEGDHIPKTVTLRLDDADFDVVEVSGSGYFFREIAPEELGDGAHTFQAVIRDNGADELVGAVHDLYYSKTGPWVKFNSVHLGSFVRARPWIEGHAGYMLGAGVELDQLPKDERKGYKIAALEFSLDNGQNFIEMKPDAEWRFRLETQELTEGDLAVLVRATFANGEIAQARTLVIVDDTTPRITLVTPEEGKAFNDIISVSGTAFDENGISDISVMLRKGSKNNYGVPQFIQGLYLDSHFMGATVWEAGIGLTFFDDNVKLQFIGGQAPQGRFNGYMVGLKLLANVATIPYGYFFGPDWEWLSSSVAIGSTFEYFTMSDSQLESEDGESPSGLVLGAVVAQVELLKMRFPNLKMFNTYSLYQETQIWFISSDIEGGLDFRFSLGARIGVF